ncbi:MAG: hypothetical protein ABSE89_10865 [Sedimentisphaerales bacterium]
MKIKPILVLAGVVVLQMLVSAEIITIFDSNAVIADSNTYDTVVVKGNGTVVNMTGGTINKLITMDASIFNMTNGSIATIQVHGLSTLNVSGNSTLTSGSSYCAGKGHINFFGNALCTAQLKGFHSAAISISEDANLQYLYCYDNCKAIITGGTLSSVIFGKGNSQVDISGGTVGSIGCISGLSNDRMRVNIIGYNLTANPYSESGSGIISGNWNSGLPFSISFYETYLFDIITLYDGSIPADCINQPESDLNGDCKVDFKDFSKMAAEWLKDGTQ